MQLHGLGNKFINPRFICFMLVKIFFQGGKHQDYRLIKPGKDSLIFFTR